MKEDLKQKALALPLTPGVYLMLGRDNTVLYVGKAKQLKNRVSQYFQDSAAHNEKTRMLVSRIHDFDTILVNTELEALVLESSLIKQHQPHFNILLKDDKGFPFIRLSVHDPYPRFSLASKWAKDGARYFGPYGGRNVSRQVINTLSAAIGLPVCNHRFPQDVGRDRPCLHYHTRACQGFCRPDMGQRDYQVAIEQAISILEGQYKQVAAQIERDMLAAAEELHFEKAAQLRDRLHNIVKLSQKQYVVSGSLMDTDVAGYFAGEDVKTCVTMLHYREGLLHSRDVYALEDGFYVGREEALSAFLVQYYAKRGFIPRHLLLPFSLPDEETLSAFFSHIAGRPVSISVPQRGDKRKLTDMAGRQAAEEAARLTSREETARKTTLALQKLLGLSAPPSRIEAYDISNTGDANIVGAMTVHIDGAPRKKEYKHYKMTDQTADDYEAMRNMLTRRLTRLANGDAGFDKAPDLILLDGGLGHVQAILPILKEHGLALSLFGMVKDNRHRTRALITVAGQELGLSAHPALFALIGRIQEETHRFAVSFHQAQRGKQTLQSTLTQIPGVGAARRTALLTHFKTLKAIKNATLEELSALVPAPVARAVQAYFSKT